MKKGRGSNTLDFPPRCAPSERKYYLIYWRGWLNNMLFLQTMLRNATSKMSCRRFVKNQVWWDTVVNNYSDERFKYTFRTCRNMFKYNYIRKNIWGGLQKQIVTKLPINPEIRLAICLYKLTRGDFHYVIGEMAGIAQSTVCRISNKKKTFYFLKLKFLNIRFQIKVTIAWKYLNKFELSSE